MPHVASSCSACGLGGQPTLPGTTWCFVVCSVLRSGLVCCCDLALASVERLKTLNELLVNEMLQDLHIKTKDRVELYFAAKQLVNVMFLQGSASYLIIGLKLAGKVTSKREVVRKIEGRLHNGMCKDVQVTGEQPPKAWGNPIVLDAKDVANFLHGHSILNSTASPCVSVFAQRSAQSEFGPIHMQLWAGHAAHLSEQIWAHADENFDCDGGGQGTSRQRSGSIQSGSARRSTVAQRVPRTQSTQNLNTSGPSINFPSGIKLDTSFSSTATSAAKFVAVIDIGSGEFKRYLVKLEAGKPIDMLEEDKDEESAEIYNTNIKELYTKFQEFFKSQPNDDKRPEPPAEEWQDMLNVLHREPPPPHTHTHTHAHTAW